jgi:hypothetical protein
VINKVYHPLIVLHTQTAVTLKDELHASSKKGIEERKGKTQKIKKYKTHYKPTTIKCVPARIPISRRRLTSTLSLNKHPDGVRQRIIVASKTLPLFLVLIFPTQLLLKGMCCWYVCKLI